MLHDKGNKNVLRRMPKGLVREIQYVSKNSRSEYLMLKIKPHLFIHLIPDIAYLADRSLHWVRAWAEFLLSVFWLANENLTLSSLFVTGKLGNSLHKTLSWFGKMKLCACLWYVHIQYVVCVRWEPVCSVVYCRRYHRLFGWERYSFSSGQRNGDLRANHKQKGLKEGLLWRTRTV